MKNRRILTALSFLFVIGCAPTLPPSRVPRAAGENTQAPIPPSPATEFSSKLEVMFNHIVDGEFQNTADSTHRRIFRIRHADKLPPNSLTSAPYGVSIAREGASEYQFNIFKKNLDHFDAQGFAMKDFKFALTFFLHENPVSEKSYECLPNSVKGNCTYQLEATAVSDGDELNPGESANLVTLKDLPLRCSFTLSKSSDALNLTPGGKFIFPTVSEGTGNKSTKKYAMTFSCALDNSKKTVLKGYFLQNVPSMRVP